MWQVVQQVLAQAWQQFSNQSLALLPNVLASLLFLAVGVILGVVAGRIAKFLLRRSAVERRATRLGLTSWLERAGILSATAAVVRLVQVVFALVTVALVLYSLDAALASDLTKRFFLYLPDLVVGIAIFFIGLLAARVVVAQRADRRGQPRPASGQAPASLTRGGIVALSSAVALDQVGIGRTIVPAAMLILLGGVTLALALAVGLGSREAVSRWIDDRLGHPVEPESDGIQHW